ncbi:MAG: FixH family protein [Bacteroidia bacterium]|nr:FixH family protein [Bacteroidia bacterium]
MKINWGWGIAIVLILFMVFILNLVFRCAGVKVDLVSENYYENEIKYQQQIDREKNALNLSQDIQISKDEQSVRIVYPPEFNRNEINGTITFFKPDDAGLDFVLDVNPEESMIQQVSTDRLKSGWWQVKIQWTYKEVEYYSENKLLI